MHVQMATQQSTIRVLRLSLVAMVLNDDARLPQAPTLLGRRRCDSGRSQGYEGGLVCRVAFGCGKRYERGQLSL